MKQTLSLRSVLQEAFAITWRQKAWWFVGLLAFFLSGSLGYQLITQGLSRLVNPVEWVNRWSAVSAGLSPLALLRGQWTLLTTNPSGWFTLVGVWLLIGLVLFFFLFIAAYALTTILSAVKIREEQGMMLFGAALREAWYHVRTVLAVVIIAPIISNLLLALFSGPVLALTMQPGSFFTAIVLMVLFVVYAVLIIALALIVIYTLVAAVMYDLSLVRAIKFAWLFFWRNWLISVLLLLAQIAITLVAALALVIIISFILIPITILGYVLVANQQYDITQFLPNLILLLIMLGFLVFGAAYTVFQLASWALLFLNAQDDGVSVRVSIEEISM